MNDMNASSVGVDSGEAVLFFRLFKMAAKCGTGKGPARAAQLDQLFLHRTAITNCTHVPRVCWDVDNATVMRADSTSRN